MGFNLSEYEQVEVRLEKFWADHPKGRIETEVLKFAGEPGQRWVVKALAFREGEDVPAATGHAFEVDGQGNVNKTAALENCETSAIGRALADMGYAAKGKRPSREEMSKTAGGHAASQSPSQQASSAAPQQPSDDPWSNGGWGEPEPQQLGSGDDWPCPKCGSPIRGVNSSNPKAPKWACTNEDGCRGGKNGKSWVSWKETLPEAVAAG